MKIFSLTIGRGYYLLFPNILRPVLMCKPRPSGLSIFVNKVFALLSHQSHLCDVWFVNKVCDCEFVNKVFTLLSNHSHMCEIEIKLNWTIHSNKTFSYCYEHWEGDGLAGPLGRNFYTLSCFALQVKETFGAESNQSLKTCFSILNKVADHCRERSVNQSVSFEEFTKSINIRRQIFFI